MKRENMERKYNAMKNATMNRNEAMREAEDAAAIREAHIAELKAAAARQAEFATYSPRQYERADIVPRRTEGETADAYAERLKAAAAAIVTIKATIAERRITPDGNGNGNGISPANNPWRLYREDLEQQAILTIMEVLADEAHLLKRYGTAERAVLTKIGNYEYRQYERHIVRKMVFEREDGSEYETVYTDRVKDKSRVSPMEDRIIDRMTAAAIRADLKAYADDVDGKTKDGTNRALIIRHPAKAYTLTRQDLSRARARIEKDNADILTRDRAGHLMAI